MKLQQLLGKYKGGLAGSVVNPSCSSTIAGLLRNELTQHDGHCLGNKEEPDGASGPWDPDRELP